MTDRDLLIALQEIDTAVDQTRGRIDRLPERAAHREALDALAAVRSRRDQAATDLADAEQAMASIDADSAEIDAHTVRLQAQLKTIIAPREAEALQREMATLAGRRSELDDQGLDLLERISAAEETIAAADTDEPEAQSTVDAASAALTAAVGEQQVEIDALLAAREPAAAGLSASLLAQYESMRRTHSGLAVARLVGAQCTGCHIELSRAEAEIVRHVPVDELPDCPSCGRLLLP